jgi:SAM-dependent methyltransferase
VKEAIKKLIPRPLRPVASRAYYFPIDTFERLAGRRDALTPPRRLLFIGGGNFRRAGTKFLGFFKEFGHLRPDERVLDVGCGVGRMAVPLTGYLSEKGSYDGFDIVDEGIRWCRKAISGRFPNFRFQVADLYNKTYNPKGRFKAVEFPFPYPDGSFDFAILTSVFTHMLPAETEHYVAEIGRVLSPGGRCFATFFLLNEDSLRLIGEGKSGQPMTHPLPGCRVDNLETPEDAVGYPQEDVIRLLAKHGLGVDAPVRYGKWCGRGEWTSYQDILVARKC